MKNTTDKLLKRTWFYLVPPKRFDFPPCDCGNEDIEWSEYKNHVWCDKCLKDYIPKHNGILDGPIPINTISLMGITFDIFNLDTNQVEIYNIENGGYIPIPKEGKV